MHPQTQRTVRPLARSPVHVIIIGGAEDKENEKVILTSVFQAAGAAAARILVIPTASGEPDVLGNLYYELFSHMGASHVQVLNLTSRIQAEQPEVEQALMEATAVFMTGGDQVRLTSVLAHTRFHRVLQRQWQEGKLVIAGTSAGASAMSHSMIAWGTSGEAPKPSIVEMTTGMGLLPQFIIDQHFFNRNRLARLITAVATNPNCLGLGIDENTAVMLTVDGFLEVIGEGTVTLVDGSHAFTTPNRDDDQPLSVADLKIHILVHQGRFNLAKRQVILPKNSPV